MIMKFIVWGTLALVISSGVQARTVIEEQVRVIDPDHKNLKLIGNHKEFIIDHLSQLGYEVYGPTGTIDFLTEQNISFVTPDRNSEIRAAGYPTSEQTVKTVQDLAAKYPTLISLTEIGKTVQGRSLTFAMVTAPADVGTPVAERPEFKYIANMHGDEIVGRELMVKLIEDLASNYGKDARITQILNTTQVYILPSMNPDGASLKQRANAHNVDLNRSFPDFTTSDNQNTIDGREPEIQAVMKFQAAHHFKMSANFHGGSQVVNYPWDTQAELFPLDNLVQKLSLDYAKRVSYLASSTEFKNGITNGYAWYEVDGGMQDWSYNWHKDLQFTIELTNTKWPAFSTVNATYQQNRDALLAFIEDVYTF